MSDELVDNIRKEGFNIWTSLSSYRGWVKPIGTNLVPKDMRENKRFQCTNRVKKSYRVITTCNEHLAQPIWHKGTTILRSSSFPTVI